jgi:hypothetical protein
LLILVSYCVNKGSNNLFIDGFPETMWGKKIVYVLHDYIGQEIHTLSSNILKINELGFTKPISNGVYWLKMHIDGQILTRKIVVLK